MRQSWAGGGEGLVELSAGVSGAGVFSVYPEGFFFLGQIRWSQLSWWDQAPADLHSAAVPTWFLKETEAEHTQTK